MYLNSYLGLNIIINMLLSNGKVGYEYELLSVSGWEPICRRLIEYGFVRNTKIKIIQKSLGGHSLLVQLHGYVLALKSNQADFVMVKE